MPIRNNKFAAFGAAIHREMGRRLNRSGVEVVTKVREAINKPYPPASSPGNPPHRRTGALWRSVFATEAKDKVTVAADAPHAEFLERGTRRMAARPFLDKGFAKSIPVVKRIMTAFYNWTG
jgi:HK97 gp10 family phage protein